MKNLPLKNPKHTRLEQAFGDYLELTGYAAQSVYSMPIYVREFLHWIERENKHLEQLDFKQLNAYFFQLKKRRKQRQSGALSNNYLHKHLQALKRFSYYLKETDQAHFEVDIFIPKPQVKPREILTKSEIKKLYQACTNSPIGLRDRAMLAIFYGCGLRRTEGRNLDLTDFLPARKLLYIRNAKGYKERYVPLTASVQKDLENYLNYGRPSQLKNAGEKAFLLSEHGRRIQGQSLHIRLKKLLKATEINENTSLHSLRHSIATHLLESGMQLRHIAKLLGHSSLESTQIYTQISSDIISRVAKKDQCKS